MIINEAAPEIDQGIQARNDPALTCFIGLDLERFELRDTEIGKAEEH